jgi:hypothetical protein
LLDARSLVVRGGSLEEILGRQGMGRVGPAAQLNFYDWLGPLKFRALGRGS